MDDDIEREAENSDDLVYYPDHDQRYAHIPERDRWKYPDEIVLSYLSGRIKRTKPFSEVTLKEAKKYGVDPCLLANDVPYTDGCYKVQQSDSKSSLITKPGFRN